jgi:hypothetical protein
VEAKVADRFGRLVRLPAKNGWSGEASDFTPWLAENLDLLGAEIGLSLELREREHQVGRFYLDLLLEDAQGRVVVVENQFGRADHDHLGKTLTYCAGTGAEVVIWIAESFTDEHLAALEWLNDNTLPHVGFFGIEVGLLQIDTSPLAPSLRVVAKPNAWVKRVKPESTAQIAWSWEAYGEELNVPETRLAVGQALLQSVVDGIEQRQLPWQPKFNKGYVAILRPGGYKVFVVDVYWRRTPRIAMKLPAPPTDLGLVTLYSSLVDDWDPSEQEWGWTVPSVEQVPELDALIDVAARLNPESGPMKAPLP